MYKYFRDYELMLCNSLYSRLFELIKVLSVYGKCLVLFVDLQISAILPVCYHHVHEYALGLLLCCDIYIIHTHNETHPPLASEKENKDLHTYYV